MKARQEYRRRAEVEVEILDALVDRSEEGMTVFELRSEVEIDIDDIEDALGNLKRDDLIRAEKEERRTLIFPDERVVPDPDEAVEEPSIVDRIIDRLPL
ncbi:DUF6432 family protein [Halomicrococcus gelatinilyticus]|uniref:DUF6432 family protein n=1 Tax=Halomicrococcus gelatinilyticus TaxID=1702103 RepID=UPI002E15EDAD